MALLRRLPHVFHSAQVHCSFRQSNSHTAMSFGTSWAIWSLTQPQSHLKEPQLCDVFMATHLSPVLFNALVSKKIRNSC